MAISGFETDSFAEGFLRNQPVPTPSAHEFDESPAHARNQRDIALAQSFGYGLGCFLGTRAGFDSLSSGSWTWPVPFGTSIGYGFRAQWDNTTTDIAFENGDCPIRGTIFDHAFDPRVPSGLGMLFIYKPDPFGFEVVYGDFDGLPVPSPVPPALPGIWRLDISEQMICLASRLLGAAMPVVILTSSKDQSKQLIFTIGDIPAGTGFLQSPPPGTNLAASGTVPAAYIGDPNLAHIIIDTRVFFGNQTPFYPRVIWTSPGSIIADDVFQSAYGITGPRWSMGFNGTKIG